ncbi:hypothetical protein HME9304_03351 [Flagellimonas maritima]|uniref:Uncharacterized protein n=1 Tax=Flagellimonas maritima TaxID=1383885 RepID=A0A2Z4LY81_9FLAO|nr:DUF6503 family protein [Allomuricauda aurantiaca]AWX46318.1 hypothetical protein HME9304_03351 [Allomuricauda aurantiaca]
MKLSITGLLLFFLIGCSEKTKVDDQSILEKTIAVHDSLDTWQTATLNLHIQEPRVSNPSRYSILKLDNENNTFELSRNRDEHISKHIIESNGNSSVLLDGKVETDTTLIQKYRLDASRSIGYKNFYKLLYGLPMSLEEAMKEVVSTSDILFNNENCYSIEIELKEAIISKFWNIYVSKNDMTLKGVDIVFPDDPEKGDRIYFDGTINIDGLKIPRIRHWHELKDDTYSGSDLIIKEIQE